MHRLVLSLLVPLAVGAASCGGGAPTMAEFAADADAACQPANEPLGSVTQPADHPQLATAARALATAADAQLGPLRELDEPSGAGDGQIDAVWESMAALGRSATALSQAATASDDAAVQRAAADTSARYQEGVNQATTLGFKACVFGMKHAVEQISTGTKAIVKTSYIAKGDKLCSDTERALDALPSPAQARSLPEAGRFLDRPLPIVRKLVADMKALPVPAGDEAAVADLIAAQEATVAKMQQMRDAAVANQAARVLEVEKEFEAAATAADTKLTAYGFKSCGS